MKLPWFERATDALIEQELLPEFPAVMVTGPRGCGKSSSMNRFTDTILDLSKPGPRAAVEDDPDGALAAATGLVLVDEWQESEEILGAVKRAIDSDVSGTPGRFIITGSVRAAQQGKTWAGTGRFIRVRMYGLTQAELERDPSYNPINAFFSEELPKFGFSKLGRADYLERIVAGRFPAVIGHSEAGRARWYRSYVSQLIERDAPQIASRNPQPAKLKSVLESCVARTGQELNKNATAVDADVTALTANSYLELLEGLAIVTLVPAWHQKRLKRINRSPKIHVTDPGMAAELLGMDAAGLGRDHRLVGQFFESFVVTELVAHLETTAKPTELFHLRHRDGKEVDVVLEQRGQVVGLEVKSATKASRGDAKSLIWLRDKLGDDFRFGAVLYAGEIPYKIDDRVWALPIASLWQRPTVPSPNNR